MEDNFVIFIKGKQLIDGHVDENELNTSCTFEKTENSFIIKYNELDENHNIKSNNTLIFEDSGLVNIIKENAGGSKITLEKDKRHLCNYSTEYGIITLGTFTKDIVFNFNDNGGTARLEYSLELDSKLMSENTVIINLNRR